LFNRVRFPPSLTSHFQGGHHDVIFCRKVLPPGESMRSVFLAAMQHRRQFLIYSTFVLVQFWS